MRKSLFNFDFENIEVLISFEILKYDDNKEYIFSRE